MPASVIRSRMKSITGRQYPVPIRMIGNCVIFLVWTSVAVSNSSSSVPNPPGSTTNAHEYFTSITLRTKKYRNSMNLSRYRFGSCSIGSTMLQPSDSPPASRAPRLAASMMPGPPPVMTANPARASCDPTSRACS